MPDYDFKAIEPKWQAVWQRNNLFAASDSAASKRMYVLDMFPYPSGDGLHVGHVKIYTAADVVARYLRMKGFNVLHPTGWDAFGLPTENTAIKMKIHPAELTKKNVDRFRGQMQRLGWSYDWDREINTTDPAYYKWTQWIFLKLFKMGLVYEDTININWCPQDKTGLANEEVVAGKCDRCGTPVEKRPMRHWMMRITKYADRLLESLAGLDWPPFVLEAQRNWIGRSEGLEEEWEVEGLNLTLKTFTTWPHTTWGATFMVIAPEHAVINQLVQATSYEAGAKEFVAKVIQDKIKNPANIEKNKEGFFLGRYVINHLNGRRMPLYIANFAIYDYGTGIVKCTPAHDQRDYEFAKKYNLEIIPVIQPKEFIDLSQMTQAYTGEGTMINAGQFDGVPSEKAREAIANFTTQKGHGRRTVNYKLRDWVFSRQRYWGEPIPLIHCQHCGVVPVPEKDLPVLLPPVEQYEPTGTGESPLAAIESWVNVKCPTCPRQAKRETNTMPQWAGSSWYWLRYLSPGYSQAFVDPEQLSKWMPVELYIGGAEHAVLHLLYARFWTKALFDAGLLPHDEPFKRFRAVGLILGEDGQKMSKSRGNVINPDTVVEKYGADTLRVYEMFMGPFEHTAPWDTHSIAGSHRFLKRVWNFVGQHASPATAKSMPEEELVVQLALKRASESIENFKFNTAISALMELLNSLEKLPNPSKSTLERFVLLLAPLAPHIAEELWRLLGHSQSLMYEPWPKLNPQVINSAQKKIPVQVNGRVRAVVTVPPDTDQASIETQAKALPNIAKYLATGQLVRVIYVPNKSLNFVVN